MLNAGRAAIGSRLCSRVFARRRWRPPSRFRRPPAAATPGQIAAYGFEETSGATALDSSGSALDGALSGPARTASGRFGRALTFDGVNDLVSATSTAFALTGDVTLEAWVQPTVAGTTWRTAVFKERTGGMSYALYANTDTSRPTGQVYTTGEMDARGTAALPLNAWSHLAMTYDRSAVRLFVNGVQVASKASALALAGSTGPLRIGGNTIWPEWFNGNLDEVRVYNRALSAAEIQGDMATPVVVGDTTPPTTPSLQAAVAADDITVTWGPATDASGVAEYRLHRGTTSGFTPDAANIVATATGPGSYLDKDRANGTYFYKVVAVDTAGNVSAAGAASATVTPDTTAPTVAVSSPAEGASLRGPDMHLFADAADDRKVVSVRYDVDGVTLGNGSQLGGWHRDFDVSLLADGPHVVQAFALDAAGNQGVSPVRHFVVDNGVPAGVTIFTPSDNATVSGTVPLTITTVGTIAYGTIWRLDGALLFGNHPQLKGDPNPWPWDSTTVADGPHTLKAEVINSYGVVLFSRTLSITVRNHNAPFVSASVDDDDVTITFSGGTNYKIHRGTTAGFTPSAANLVTTSPSSGSYTDTKLATGTYYYKVLADGTSEPGTATAVIAPDATSPTIVLSSPSETSPARGEYAVMAEAQDNRAVTAVSVTIDGLPTIYPLTRLGDTTSTSWFTELDGPLLTDGLHTMVATARDAAGNQTVTAPKRFVVDNGDPITLSVTQPVDGATLAGTFTPHADWGGTYADYLKWKIDGVSIFHPILHGDPNDYPIDISSISDGVHTLTADVTSGYGVVYKTQSIQIIVRNHTSDPSLVAAYGFEETSGTSAVDSSPNALNGTVSGATRLTAGRFGRALTFDGVNDFVGASATPFNLTGDVTLEAWVRPTATGTNWRTAVFKERTGGMSYALYANTNTGRPAGQVYTTSEIDARGPAGLALNVWSHIAMTYDRTAVKLYVNGVQVASKASTLALAGSTGPLKIGGNAIWGEWFKGDLDEVRVYKRALTAAEIVSDSNASVVPGT